MRCCRKLSSRILLYIDCNPTTIVAAVFEWCLGQHNTLFASSPRKNSSLFNSSGVRIQFSEPYRSIGITQVSITEAEEDGLRLPWKTPILSKLKNAFVAFWMLSSTLYVARRSFLHQKPKHFLASLIGLSTLNLSEQFPSIFT